MSGLVPTPVRLVRAPSAAAGRVVGRLRRKVATNALPGLDLDLSP